MKTYEVIIQKGQPSCGGKAPQKPPPRQANFLGHVRYLITTIMPLRESGGYTQPIFQRM